MVGIKKLWYKMAVNEVLDFFVTNSNSGLNTSEITVRAKKFGYNKPDFLDKATQKYFTYKTIRGGKIINVASNELVLGDIIMLKAGDIAPADIRLIKVNKFSVNEEYITGSPGRTPKNTFLAKSLLPKDKQKNMVFESSIATSGAAYGVIVAYSDLKKVKLRNNELKKRLSKNNIYLNKQITQAQLKTINTVIFDDLRRDYEVIKSFQKIYLEKGITCIYFLDSITLKKLQYSAPEAVVLKSKNYKPNINGVVFIENPKSSDKTQIIAKLVQANHESLYVYRGEHYEPAASVASLSLVTTDRSCQEALHKATLITDKLNINTLSSILYNIK